MTSDVKSWVKIFYVFIPLSHLVGVSEETGPVKTTVDPADIRGLGTTLLCPSGACLALGARIGEPLNAIEGYAETGAAPPPTDLGDPANLLGARCDHTAVISDHWACGNGPHERDQFSGNRDHHLFGCLPRAPSRRKRLHSRTCAFHLDVLDRLGQFFEAQLQMPAHFGGIAIGPGAFDERPAGVALPALVRPPCRRRSPLEYSEGIRPRTSSAVGGYRARQVAEFGDGGDGHGELDATEGLERFDDRDSARRSPVLGVLGQAAAAVRCVR